MSDTSADKPREIKNPDTAEACPALEDWISDRKKRSNARWAAIGDEVIQRKTLWLTAAKELRKQEIDDIEPYKVSATDVFVEKAQMAISERAEKYHKLGFWVAGATIALMITACAFLWFSLGEVMSRPNDFYPLQFSVIVIRMITVGALIGGVGYFLVGIARAFLHEGTALYSRRHALRFGRLYVYLKGGEIKDIDELEKAFKWNDAVHTAFMDIRPDKATKSFAQLVSDVGIEAIKTGASVAGRMRDKKDNEFTTLVRPK